MTCGIALKTLRIVVVLPVPLSPDTSTGYLSKALAADLFEKGVTLVTTVRKNMKAKTISLWDRAMLSRRYIIETINDPLKNISYIEHSRHRSMNGFMLNLIAELVAYCLKKDKPSLNLTDVELNSMIIA
jgi:hypothetical protein